MIPRKPGWGSPEKDRSNRFRLAIDFTVMALIASMLSSCHMSGARSSLAVAGEPDFVRFTGPVPVWIFIPAPAIIDQSSGFPAAIALPPRRGFSTNRIEVVVSGEVVSPGTFNLPAGCTVLEAIGRAGGFTRWAYNKKILFHKSSGAGNTLYLRFRPLSGTRYREVWYALTPAGPYLSPRNDEGVVADHVLQAGDRIHVRRTM